MKDMLPTSPMNVPPTLQHPRPRSARMLHARALGRHLRDHTATIMSINAPQPSSGETLVNGVARPQRFPIWGEGSGCHHRDS
jgi:hypothetical protein